MIESLIWPGSWGPGVADDEAGSVSGGVARVLAGLADQPGRLPFDAMSMAFVAEMARVVLTSKAFRSHPELIAMAHWFRAANLPHLRAQLMDAKDASIAPVFVRRGLVFHIAPSNVDSVFIYSWLLSLLCGNANVARVSRRRTSQMQAFFKQVGQLLLSSEFAPLAANNWVLSYDHDAELTAAFSAACHLRVIWGGDDTISLIRQTPLPALSAELAFANRFSMAVFHAQAVAALDDAGLHDLVRRFYNDVFWFQQRACSSPKAVWWVGSEADCELARARLWPAMQREVDRKLPDNDPAQVMNRATTLFALAHGQLGAAAQTAVGMLPSRVLLNELTESERALHDGQGLFIELMRPTLDEVMCSLVSRDQTLAHFGFSRETWLSVLPQLPPHAADRIVPMGEALAFSSVWDGVNLLRAFTREIQIS